MWHRFCSPLSYGIVNGVFTFWCAGKRKMNGKWDNTGYNNKKVMTIRIHWGWRIFNYGGVIFIIFIFGSIIWMGLDNMLAGIISFWIFLLGEIFFICIAAFIVIPLIRSCVRSKITLRERSITIRDYKYGINRVPKAKENNFWDKLLFISTESSYDLNRLEAVVYGSIDSIAAYCRDNHKEGFLENLDAINALNQKKKTIENPYELDANYLFFPDRKEAFTAIGVDYFSKRRIMLLLENMKRRGVRVVMGAMWAPKFPATILPMPKAPNNKAKR